MQIEIHCSLLNESHNMFRKQKDALLFVTHFWRLVKEILNHFKFIVIYHIKCLSQFIKAVEMRVNNVQQVKYRNFPQIFLSPKSLTKTQLFKHFLKLPQPIYAFITRVTLFAHTVEKM
jgi:hypothetical protein